MASEHASKKGKQPPRWLQALIGVLTLTAVAMVILLGSQTYRKTRKMATAQFNQQQLILARSAATGIESYYKELAATLQSLVKLPSMQQMTPECLQCIQHAYWGLPSRTSIRLLDRNGLLRFICPFEGWRGDLNGKEYGREAYFQEVRETGHIHVKRVINEQGEPRIRVAVPVYLTSESRTVKVGEETGMIITPMDPDKPGSGAFQGVLIGSFDPHTIAQSFISPIVSGKTGYAYLLNEEGIFIAHHEEAFSGRSAFEVREERNPDLSYDAVGQMQRRMMAGEEGTGRYVSGWHRGVVGEIEKLVAYTPIHINGNIWSVAVCAPVCEVEKMIGETKRSGQAILGLVILILILGGGSLFAVSYRWSHVLEQEVAERTKDLRETTDYLNNLIRCANAPIIVWNRDKQVTMFNEAFERMSGRTEAEMKEQPLAVLFPEDTRADSMKKIEETSKGEHWETVEIPILKKNGETLMALWNSANIYGEDGTTLMATIAQGQDITERVRAVERIERLNSVLRAIRNVNQLIVSEKDRDPLLQKVCDALIEARDYDAAWLGALMDGKSFAAVKGSGLGEEVSRFRERVMDGDYPPCIENALDGEAPPLLVVDKSETCGDCFFKEACAAREVAILRVEHANRLFGLLAVSLASDVAVDDEEKSLLIEVAGDIGLALHGMELEEARKRAEEELKVRARILESMAEGVNMSDENGSIFFTNPVFDAMFGYERGELIGKGVWILNAYPPEESARIVGEVMEQLKTHGTWSGEFDNLKKDGTPFSTYVRVSSLEVSGKEYWISVQEDITERKKMEEELIRLSDAVKMTTDSIVISDIEAKITDVNESTLKMYGTGDRADLIGKSSFDFIVPEDREKAVAGMKEVAEKGYIKNQRYHIVIKDGSRVSVEMSASIMKGAGGEPIGLVGITRDITEREQAAEALRESEKMSRRERDRLRNIFEAMDDGVYIVDRDYNIEYVNPVLTADFGPYEGRKCYAYFHDLEEACPWCKNQDVFAGKTVRWEWYLSKNGKTYDLIDTPLRNADGTISKLELFRDITEHKHLEEQLRQAQKMEAIGTLTGGVAHDFNNILTALQGNTELALMNVPEDDPVARNLIEIRKGIERAARLTHQLLLFSRQQPMERTILNLNVVVDELTKMLKRLIGEHISLSTELASGLWKVKGDFGTIEQVIMNLVVNARDAMPKRGTISIRTRNAEVDEVFCSACKDARPGRFVCLSVRDSGVGIDPAIRDRIFDPFFTTKGLGVGTGLGLSVVYGIVKQHEGWITIESAPENGALFSVYLPAISIEPEENPQNASVSLEAFRGSGERILVVEDEEIIRDLSEEVLSQSGYAAFPAANAREALELFEKEGGNFDLLFCDVVLPDGRGPELSEQFLKRNPGLGVLFTSGYMDEESDWRAIRERGYPFLQKPYSPSDFLRAVRDALKKH